MICIFALEITRHFECVYSWLLVPNTGIVKVHAARLSNHLILCGLWLRVTNVARVGAFGLVLEVRVSKMLVP